jgi:hypothetical protein
MLAQESLPKNKKFGISSTEAQRKRRNKIRYLRRSLCASVSLCLCVSLPVSISNSYTAP